MCIAEVTIKQLRDRLKECDDKAESTAEVRRVLKGEVTGGDKV